MNNSEWNSWEAFQAIEREREMLPEETNIELAARLLNECRLELFYRYEHLPLFQPQEEEENEWP